MPLSLLALLACSAPGAPTPSADRTATHVSSPLGLRPPARWSGGPLDPDAFTDLAIAATPDVATVLRVTWRSPDSCRGSAEFSGEGGPTLSAAEPAATLSHSLLLLGTPADTDVDVIVSCTYPDGSGISVPLAGRTGPLPEGLKDLTLEGDPDPDGGFLTAPYMEAIEAATIVDMSGRIVWYTFETADAKGTRVRVSVDGQSVLYNVQDQSPGGVTGRGGIVRVSWDGSTTEKISIPGHSHDYVELADGTIAALAADIREEDGVSYNGDQLVEIATDGTERVVWSAWDTWTVAEAPPSHAEGTSWTHANAVDYDPDTDTYWLNCRNLSVLLHIDRSTGEVLDQFGGPTPSWTFAEGSVGFEGEHQFVILPDGLLMFDNQYTSHNTRAVEYGFDATSQTMVQRWEVLPEEAWFAQALGDVARVREDEARVTFSTAGAIRLYTREGEAVWTLSAPVGSWIGYTDHLDALAQE